MGLDFIPRLWSSVELQINSDRATLNNPRLGINAENAAAFDKSPEVAA
jgi:hypothetical protein